MLGLRADRLQALANTPRRDAGATRGLYSYPAKFQAHLPAALIQASSAPGDLVVDPFMGGGTTALEAYLAGRRFLGSDLSPLAHLVARVKTTPVPAAEVLAVAQAAARHADVAGHLDAEDIRVLGASAEPLGRLAAGLAGDTPAHDVCRLSLVQTLRTVGRRDFAGADVTAIFLRRATLAAEVVAALPAGPRPDLHVGPARALPLADGAARLVVTSPPYKDVDVEYVLLQIQRPGISRRSRFAWRLLGHPPLPKRRLCGGIGDDYFTQLAPSLAEIHRVLAPGGLAFFWVGWKRDGDRAAFHAHLERAGLSPVHEVRARLGRDRSASSRSLHHDREAGLNAIDYLVACSKRAA